jgi:AcrR family transcriptional regulator
MAASAPTDGLARRDPGERILDTAYELFSRRGVRNVGVDEVIAHAGVAKATLYARFLSKDHLVLAFLERREQRWTLAFLATEARRRGTTPEEQLLAIFDVLDEWFRRDDFEGCSFIRVLLELGAEHAAGRASVHYLDNIRSIVQGLALEAGLRDSEEFARSCHLLMEGSIIAAAAGDADAALRAKAMADTLIERFRSP